MEDTPEEPGDNPDVIYEHRPVVEFFWTAFILVVMLLTASVVIALYPLFVFIQLTSALFKDEPPTDGQLGWVTVMCGAWFVAAWFALEVLYR